MVRGLLRNLRRCRKNAIARRKKQVVCIVIIIIIQTVNVYRWIDTCVPWIHQHHALMSVLLYASRSLVHTVRVLRVLGVLSRADTRVLELAHNVVDNTGRGHEGPERLQDRGRVRAEAKESHPVGDAMVKRQRQRWRPPRRRLSSHVDSGGVPGYLFFLYRRRRAHA